jgi:hypothetical protein
VITREQVADLQPGDVVEYRRDDWPEGALVRGPVEQAGPREPMYVLKGIFGIAEWDGSPFEGRSSSLTVISRAPRPLYINHPRTEPVQGDVVRDEGGAGLALFICTHDDEETWWLNAGADWIAPAEMQDKRLRLLVDGETGQVVPS